MAFSDEMKQKINRYRSCFLTDAGKFVLEDLDKECFYRKDLFNPHSERTTCYNLGANWVIRYIHDLLEKKEELQPRQQKSTHETVNLGEGKYYSEKDISKGE